MNPDTRMQTPALSLVIPTHLRAHLLERALASVRGQGVDGEIEVIVVSDAADPATDLVAAKWLTPRDTFVRRSGRPGPSASRNLGLSLAKGPHVLFLDDDDSLAPGFLREAIAHPVVKAGGFAWVDGEVVTESRPPTGPVERSRAPLPLAQGLDARVYVKNQVPFSCFLFPRHLLQGVAFDEHMRAYEDWEFVLSVVGRQWPRHLALTGPCIHVVDDHTTDRRGSSAAAQDLRAVMDYLYVYHRHPAPDEAIRQQRWEMMQLFSVPLPAAVY